METLANLRKLIKRENKFQKLSPKEKSFLYAYEKTLGGDVTSEQLEAAREKMNSIDLSPEVKGNLKSMLMKDRNREEALKKDRGGDISKKSNKKDKIAVMIAVGKPKMAYGGSVKGKKHFYSNGGSVKDNAGLIALGKQSPSTYKKITGKEFKNEYKGP